MLKRILTISYRLVWYTFAIIVLTAAVLVTALRLALPGIGGYKEEIQSWVSEYMDYPVTIDDISAEWEGWAPHLFLNNIDLYTQDTGELISKFDSAHIGIDLYSSIVQGEVVPHYLSVSGLELEFTRNTDGTISISSDSKNRISTSANENNTALTEWLLKQRYIILENAKLSWNDEKTDKNAVEFSDVKLELKTDAQRVQVDGFINLPDEYGKALHLNMDFTGNILADDWDGDIYIEAENVLPDDLVKELPMFTEGGVASLKLWTTWKQAKLSEFNAMLDYKDFSLHYEDYELPVDLALLNFYGERIESKDWLVNITTENMLTANGSWPKGEYQLNIEHKEDDIQYHAYLSYLKPGDVLPLLANTNILPQEIKQTIDWSTIEGELGQTNLSINPKLPDTFKLNTNFNNLDISSSDKQHWFKGLAGQLSINNKLLRLELDSQNSQLYAGTLYEKPLELETVNSTIELNYAETPEIDIIESSIIANAIPVKTSGNIQFDTSSPFVDLVVQIGKTDIERIPSFLPVQTKIDLATWLKQALAGGELSSGDLLYRGYLTDFPFKNDEGKFKAILNIANATLDYNKGWPPIDNTDIEVIFDNESIYASTNYGYIFDAKISSINAVIDDFTEKKKNILINGSLSGHTSDIRNFIEQSPLNKNSGLADIKDNLAGSILLDIDLDIPLHEKKTAIDGEITFSDTTFISSLPGLSLEDINGKIDFTRNDVWASDIEALYYGKPVTVTIPKLEQGAPDSRKFILTAEADKAFIVNQLDIFFPESDNISASINDYLNGQSRWEVTINSAKQVDNKTRKLIEISTNLDGTSIALPEPIGKDKQGARPLSIKTRLLDSIIEKIDISYDGTLFTDIMLDNTQDLKVKKIIVGLGDDDLASEPNSDISFQGELDNLDLSEWIKVFNFRNINNRLDQTHKKHRSLSFSLFVKNLKMLDNNFRDVQIDLSRPEYGWKIKFDSDDIKGIAQLTEAQGSGNDRLQVDLEHIVISGSDTEKENSTVAINNLPELEVNIAKTIYKGNDLGEARLLTTNIDNGINIDELQFKKEGFIIEASGQWTRDDGVDRSEFIAALNSESIVNMFKTFGYDGANIEGGKTTINLSANWMDTPMNFALEKINGELEMDIDKGQFLDIDPAAGRLFGLLSLQTLPRRLALDFTDLFKKGFAFDSISGDFSLQQGHAYTNDLQMKGPAADIIVSGRTGIITEDYDQIATITPKLSNSLPVASALFGPVGIGVGAVIYLTGELFDSIPKNINKILSYQYSITGSWDNPSIEKIKDKQSG